MNKPTFDPTKEKSLVLKDNRNNHFKVFSNQTNYIKAKEAYKKDKSEDVIYIEISPVDGYSALVGEGISLTMEQLKELRSHIDVLVDYIEGE